MCGIFVRDMFRYQSQHLIIIDTVHQFQTGRLRGLAVACWTTDHYHPCSNTGVGISEGCFVSFTSSHYLWKSFGPLSLPCASIITANFRQTEHLTISITISITSLYEHPCLKWPSVYILKAQIQSLYKLQENFTNGQAELYCAHITETNLMKNALRCVGVTVWNTYAVLSYCNCPRKGLKSRLKQCLFYQLSYVNRLTLQNKMSNQYYLHSKMFKQMLQRINRILCLHVCCFSLVQNYRHSNLICGNEVVRI